MNTLTYKTDHFTHNSTLDSFFDLEEIEILTEELKVLACQKGQTIYVSPDCLALVMLSQTVPNLQQAKEAIRLEQVVSKNELTITAIADGIYCTLEKHKMQDLLEKHPFLALKFNQMMDTRLTYLLGKN